MQGLGLCSGLRLHVNKSNIQLDFHKNCLQQLCKDIRELGGVGFNRIDYQQYTTNPQYPMFDVQGTPICRGWPLGICMTIRWHMANCSVMRWYRAHYGVRPLQKVYLGLNLDGEFGVELGFKYERGMAENWINKCPGDIF